MLRFLPQADIDITHALIQQMTWHTCQHKKQQGMEIALKEHSGRRVLSAQALYPVA